jgi:hypothetical protein
MEIVNSKQTDLVYQKQLLNALQKIVDFRTQLISDAALIANEGKSKEWSSIGAQIKHIKKQVEKGDDINLKIITSILLNIEDPILKLEKNLELKNSIQQTISEQSLKESPIAETV